MVSRFTHGVRPFNPYRDLGAVIELIALAFGDKLGPAGQIALAKMRRTASWNSLWGLLWPLWGRGGVAPGFVWVEEGRVVGNVSLRRAPARGGFFIGNLVVHPDWRECGIAGALMAAALERVSARDGHWVGLEVRADNQVARRFYEGLKFRELGRTMHMLRPVGLPVDGNPSAHPSLRRGRSSDSAALVELVRAVVPASHRPLLELREDDYRSSWEHTLDRWLEGQREIWWVLEENGAICGAVRALRECGRRPDRLEVLVASEHSGRFETALVQKGMANLRGVAKKGVETILPNPTEPLITALERVGFRRLRVLVQMQLNLVHHISVIG